MPVFKGFCRFYRLKEIVNIYFMGCNWLKIMVNYPGMTTVLTEKEVFYELQTLQG